MGVKRCFRKGCDTTMCDRYSPKYGYICTECICELESLEPETYADIAKFMDTPKKNSLAKLEQTLDEIFPL